MPARIYKMSLCKWILDVVAVTSFLYQFIYAQETRIASQCFKSRGIPKVSFECKPNEMIRITKAFHGIASADRSASPTLIPGQPAGEAGQACVPPRGQQFANCTYCEGDCIDDSMNVVYDWSTCMGNTSCIRTVMQSYMPSCPGREKFSDYLQVEYQCIDREEVFDICSSTDEQVTHGYIISPNYPEHYPVNQDCQCSLDTAANSKILLSFLDLLLETRDGRCRADWLMIRQTGQKHRHCGAIMTGSKNVTTESNAVSLQFHSDEFDNRTQNFQYFTRKLKGFWLYFEAPVSINVVCRKLTAQDEEVKEIATDDASYNDATTKDNTTDSDNSVTSQIPSGGHTSGKGATEGNVGRQKTGITERNSTLPSSTEQHRYRTSILFTSLVTFVIIGPSH